jgi:hypothetical protein
MKCNYDKIIVRNFYCNLRSVPQTVCRVENLLCRENWTFSFSKSMKKNWLVCREIYDFGFVCRGSKKFGENYFKVNK